MRFLLLFLLISVPVRAPATELEPDVKRFLEAYNALEKYLADPISDPEPAFYQGAIPGMVHTLDPHSAFLDRQQYESLKDMQTSTETGFGSVLQLVPGRVVVLQTLEGSPSARAGLAPGDEMVAINNLPLTEMDTQQLASVLGQSRRSKAELLVRRAGFARLIPITLVPAELADPSVQRKFFLKPGIAYIKVVNFDLHTAEELAKVIDEMGGHKIKGLVLDMRDNPGGVVEAAVRIASFFLKPGQRILWIQGRDGPQEEVRVPEGFEPFEFPISVLINGRTASAAELVSGALQDHDRAAIIGEPSFGKGLVQSVFELPEGAALAITTAQYLTPSGRSIQRSLGDCRIYQLVHCEDEQQDPPKEFKTDAGRVVSEKGGIHPDQLVYPRGYVNRLEAVMDMSNSFLDFAQRYVREHPGISEDFQVSPRLLDEFKLFLSERRIQPDLSEWTSTVDFVRERLQQEIFNLTLGVAKGDEVEARRDAPIQAALQAVEQQASREDRAATAQSPAESAP
jgi:carboxyl-terminal processing protease